jgi:predicted dinucleotide-binding enzyme
MRIGIVGTGNMGRSLGLVWATLGHEVKFGTRSAEKAVALSALARPLGTQARVSTGSDDEAAEFGEVVYFNPRDVSPSDVLKRPSSLDGKIVIDSHNGSVPPDLDFPPIQLSHAERLQQLLPRAKVVKAFNTMAQEVLELCPEEIRPHRVSVFIASDFEEGRRVAGELAAEMGMVPLDYGPLRRSRHLEMLGDVIRTVMISRRELLATLSVQVLPPSKFPEHLGRREPTKLK